MRTLLVLFVTLALAVPVGAQPGDSAVVVDTPVVVPAPAPTPGPAAPSDSGVIPEPLDTRDESFPSPFELALVLTAVFGALGAFAGDLAADNGIIERRSKTDTTYTLGWLSNLVIGSVAALVVLTMNPPGGWASLIGTALTAGLGGKAILVSIASARDAQAARADTEAAQANTEAVRTQAKAELDKTPQLVAAFAAGQGASGAALDSLKAAGAVALGGQTLHDVVQAHVDQAKQHVDRTGRPPANPAG